MYSPSPPVPARRSAILRKIQDGVTARRRGAPPPPFQESLMSLIISFLCSAAWSRIFVADRDESPRSMSSMGTTPSVIAGPKSSRSLSGGNCIKSLRSNRTTSCRSCVDPNVLVCATCFRNTSQLEVTSTPNMHQELSLTISMLVNVRKSVQVANLQNKNLFS